MQGRRDNVTVEEPGLTTSVSVIPEAAHPLRPGFGAGAAGFCPGPRRVKLPMPLERPQLLDAYFSEREVEESNIDRSLVAGKAKTLYFRPARTPIGYIGHIFRRRVGRQRLAVNCAAAGEQRYPRCEALANVDRSPEPVDRLSSGGIKIARCHRGIANPAVHTVAAGRHLKGAVGAPGRVRIDGAVASQLCRRGAEANLVILHVGRQDVGPGMPRQESRRRRRPARMERTIVIVQIHRPDNAPLLEV